MSRQPTVAPEALSWCVSRISLDYRENHGGILEKAHQVTVHEQRFGSRTFTRHQPACGAPVPHLVEQCEPAPQGWPACRHCSKRNRKDVVPAVYYGLIEEPTP